MDKLSGDQKSDSQLIGQFGVGFYSGYIVADKITVETRRAGLPASEGVRWTSGGTGEFEVEQIERPQRGTSITLHLRPEAEEFLNAWKIKQVIGKYSDPHQPAHPHGKEEWKDGENDQPGTMEKTASGRPSTRPARCGHVPRRTSRPSSTRPSTRPSATTSRTR